MISKTARRRAALLAIASGAVLGALASGVGQAGATPVTPTTPYTFHTLNNQHDTTFNQLLGINRYGEIAGYFGSGAQGHPNKGYTLYPPFGQQNYRNENVPGSIQTQVTGLNDRGVTVGFWSDMNNASQINDNFGFWESNGHFHTVNFPTSDNATPPVNQLLGVNDNDIAAGFYTDAQGNNHGYTYDIRSGRFHRVTVAESPSVTASAINNEGDVAGFFSDASGATVGFLNHDGRITDLSVPGSSMTQPLGVNDHDEVVGVYQVGTGSSAVMHGFTWTPRFGFQTVDDPNGVGTTTVNGVNDAGDLVGFYTDAAGNVDGMLAVPTRVTATADLDPQPVGTVAVSHNPNGTLHANLQVTGLAPGIAHAVDIQSGTCDALGAPIATFKPATANAAGQIDASLDTGSSASLHHDSLMIHLGTDLTDPTANTPVACANLDGSGSYRLMPLSDQGGSVHGDALLRYDGSTETLTAHVIVSGLAPYSQHAAHLHTGSCAAQGGVVQMLPDLVANRWGVASETVTLTGITTPPTSGMYLNVHLGASSQILDSAGNPTQLFQPLTCGNLAVH